MAGRGTRRFFGRAALTFAEAGEYTSLLGLRNGNLYDFSSTQKEEEEDSRISREDEYSRRTHGNQEETEERTEKAGRLRNGKPYLPLRRKGDFTRVFDQGEKFLSRHVIIYAFPNGLASSRLGFAVGRKIGNAVTRNRVRRRLREIVRKELIERPVNLDIVIVARGAAVKADFAELRKSVRRALFGLTNENTTDRAH